MRWSQIQGVTSYPLLLRVLAPSMSGITATAIAIDNALDEVRLMHSGPKNAALWVSLSDLIRHCEAQKVASSRTVRRWAHYLDEQGFWDKQTAPGNRFQYRSLRLVTGGTIDLPNPSEIEQWMHDKSKTEAGEVEQLSGRNRDDSFSGGGE